MEVQLKYEQDFAINFAIVLQQPFRFIADFFPIISHLCWNHLGFQQPHFLRFRNPHLEKNSKQRFAIFR